MDIWIRGYMDTGYMDIWIYGYMDIWIFQYLDICIYGYTDVTIRQATVVVFVPSGSLVELTQTSVLDFWVAVWRCL